MSRGGGTRGIADLGALPSDSVDPSEINWPLTADAGSVSAPSYAFDANTGWYQPADNQIGLATDGTIAFSADENQDARFYGHLSLNENKDFFLNADGANDTKIYSPANDEIYFQIAGSGGVYRFRANSLEMRPSGTATVMSRSSEGTLNAYLQVGHTDQRYNIQCTGTTDELMIFDIEGSVAPLIVYPGMAQMDLLRGLNVKRFHDTITLDTADAETAVGLTPNGVILSAAVRVSTQVDDLDSADHHVQLGVTGTTDKYVDVANGSAATTISVNVKDSYTFDPTNGSETAALILTLTGGADNTPSAGAVEVEVVYLAATDLADV